MALAIFFLLKLLARFHFTTALEEKAPAGPTPTEKLLTEIRDELRRDAPPSTLPASPGTL